LDECLSKEQKKEYARVLNRADKIVMETKKNRLKELEKK
jgi:hypothetical protein